MMSDWPLDTIRGISAEIERMYAEIESLSLPHVRRLLYDGPLPEVPPTETAHAPTAAAERAESEPARIETVAEHGLVMAGESWSQ